MGFTVTVWRAADGKGEPARCLISERNGRWHVVLCRRAAIVALERHNDPKVALARADDLWRTLCRVSSAVLAAEPFRRVCPECREPAGVPAAGAGTGTKFVCAACQHEWEAPERGSSERRRRGRSGTDRRRRAA